MKQISLAVLFILLLSLPVLAEKQDETYLAAKAARLECTITFHNAIISDLAANVPQASGLTEQASKMTTDLAELKNIAVKDDHRAFEQLINSRLKANAKNADIAVKDLRKNFKAYGVSQETAAKLKTNFQKSLEEFKSCKRAKNYALAKERISFYTRALEKRRAQADSLAAKGVDVSNLYAILDGAQATIINPLKEATAPKVEQGKSEPAVETYCLWTGCKDGVNYHLSAKFEIEKLQAILNSLKQNAIKNGLTSQVDSIQAHLDAAQSTLNVVGNAVYTKEQKTDLWNHITLAQTELKNLISEAKK